MTVVFEMDADTARAVWHAIGTTVQLIDAVEAEPGNRVDPRAPLYGKRGVLVAAAQRLDHEINHAPGGRCHSPAETQHRTSGGGRDGV